MGATRSSTPWTEEDFATLRAMLAANSLRKDIAVALERTVEAINTKCCELGYVRKRRSDTDLAIPTDQNEPLVWARKCAEANERFCQAMEANPSERPSDMPEQGYVRRLGMRFPSRPPSWSSMGDCG